MFEIVRTRDGFDAVCYECQPALTVAGSIGTDDTSWCIVYGIAKQHTAEMHRGGGNRAARRRKGARPPGLPRYAAGSAY